MAVMERGEVEARKTDCNYIGTDHVLLVLSDEEQGDARDIFDAHKVDRARMRQLLLRD